MIQEGKDGYRAACPPCRYVGKWKAVRYHAQVALDQHRCTNRHRRHLRQVGVRPSV